MFNYLIKNGIIVDGTGNTKFKGNIGIVDKKIAYIGDRLNVEAKNIIDASGLIISPGFIDSHSHSDLFVLSDKKATNMVEQGITTEITGHCGVSPAPYTDEVFDMIKHSLEINKELNKEKIKNINKDFSSFVKYITSFNLGTNMGFLIGYGAIRIAVMGFDQRKPTLQELELMKNHVENAMLSGAIGISTGLIYPPQTYGMENEIVELCKVAAKYNGIYTTHMRNESNQVIESVKEAIRISEKANITVVISHLKVIGRRNCGNSKYILKLMDEANIKGLKIWADQYPYNASGTYLISSIPPKYLSKGVESFVNSLKDEEVRNTVKNSIIHNKDETFENFICETDFDGIMILSSEYAKYAVGKTISQLSKELGKDPFDIIFDIIINSKGDAQAVFFTMCEEDIETIMKHPLVMGGTDGSLVTYKAPPAHPRFIGAFPRILGRYVREKKLLSIEEAIRKLTFLPAEVYGLKNKGLVKEGYDADLVIFDYENIIDNSHYTDLNQKNEGIKYVFINGEMVVKDNISLNVLSGKAIMK